MFNASLSTVMFSVLIRNAVLTTSASHLKVQMPVSLTSLLLEFFSTRQLPLKLLMWGLVVGFVFMFVLFCCLVCALGFILSMLD